MVPQLASDARELGSDRRRSSDADRSQMIYRGQLLVRDCGASRKTYSSDTIGTEFRRDYAFVGLAEVEIRRYPAHFIRGFLQRGSLTHPRFQTDRKSAEYGKSVSVRLNPVGRRIPKKKKH